MNDQLQKAAEDMLKKYPQSLDAVLHYHKTFVLQFAEEYATWRLSQLPPVDEGFNEYLSKAKDDFVEIIKTYFPSYKDWVGNIPVSDMRVAAENFIIAFDQLREKHQLPPVSQSAGVWVKASEFEVRFNKRYYANWDNGFIKSTGSFQNDGTFWWNESGYVPISQNEREKLLILDESPVSQPQPQQGNVDEGLINQLRKENLEQAHQIRVLTKNSYQGADETLAGIFYKHTKHEQRNVGVGCNHEEYILAKDFGEIIKEMVESLPREGASPLPDEWILKQVEYIRRNAEKINENTWEVYKEQILGHISDIQSSLPSPPISGT